MITFSEFIEGLPVILSLVVIESLLSVDNALAIATLASELPPKQRRLALHLGVLGAYLFRVLALVFAAWIIENLWVKILGAVYLVYLMCAHITKGVGRKRFARQPLKANFWATVLSIELMDLSLSVDNVVAAVALSSKLWLVCTGVFLGIVALRFLAGFCIRLLEKYPILSKTAFLLVGYVGALLLVEIVLHREFGSAIKFTGIAVIIALSLFYEKCPFFQRLCAPVVRILTILMRLFSRGVEALFWPLRRLFMCLSGYPKGR